MTSSGRKWAAVFFIAWLAPLHSAWAGMPFIQVAQLATLRLRTISFFLVVVLLCAWGLRQAFRVLRRDLPSLPQLSFKGALALLLVWGLLFQLVLTMIAGGRELMTPGAWEPQGTTYRLATRLAPPDVTMAHARTAALERLRTALWAFAQSHDGAFPAGEFTGELPDATWMTSDPSGMRFVYAPMHRADQGAAPLAWEPGIYGPQRMVLLTSGAIETWPLERITAEGPAAAGDSTP
jgi:hypothetical protein